MLMKCKSFIIPLSFLLLIPLSSSAQLISTDFIQHYSETQLDLMGLNADNGVDAYRLTYGTPTPWNATDTASGALLLPTTDSCPNGHPFVSYQHGTVVKKDQVPSEDGSRQGGLAFSGRGYVVSMPDYLGLGKSDSLHPYHHAKSQALSSLNMIRASREHLDGEPEYPLSGELFLSGYSQGGHASMALHRYIETNNMLDSFDVKASAPLSGAYDLSGVQSQLPPDSTYGTPAYYPYIIASYQMVYGNLYDSIEEYYVAPYDTIIPQCLDGDTTLMEFNNALPNNLYSFFEDSILDSFYADTANFSHPLRLALADNDLYDWAPERKVRLYYCGGDEQVVPENSVVARDSMNTNGASDVEAQELSSNLGHSGCAPLAIQEALTLFEEERTECSTSSIPHREGKEAKLEIRRIGEDRHSVRIPSPNRPYELYSMEGKRMKSGVCKGDRFVLNTGPLPKGVYILRVKDDQAPSSLLHRRIVVD